MGRYITKTITDKRTGKRIYFYGKTQREVNQKMLDYTAKAKKGRSFKEAADLWWECAEPSLALNSVPVYRGAKERAIKEFGKTPIKDIDTIDIEKLLLRMKKQNYAKQTVSIQKIVINRIFKYAKKTLKEIEYNPCGDAELPDGLPEVKRDPASEADEEKAKEYVNIWLFPYFALMTGMRRGECLAIQKKDIDISSNVIYVNKQVVFPRNSPLIDKPKTDSSIRVVPLLDELKEVLLPILKSMSPDDYLFSCDGGKSPMTRSMYYNRYVNFAKYAGIQCTTHQLRHSFATRAFEYDVPVKSIQSILGHKKISTTMDIYTKFRKPSLKKAADLMNSKGKKVVTTL